MNPKDNKAEGLRGGARIGGGRICAASQKQNNIT